MKISWRSLIVATICAGVLSFSTYATASAEKGKAKAKTMEELLAQIKRSSMIEDKRAKERERQFLREAKKRSQMVKEADRKLISERKTGEVLELSFEANKIKIADLKKALKERLGTMGEIFGVVRQAAGDTRAQLDGSLISAQYPDRSESLVKLSVSKGLPSIKELEHLWWVLQHEMTESGKAVRFKAPVIDRSGRETEKDVLRVGPFNAISGGDFLVWNEATKRLGYLGRPPAARYLKTAGEFEKATSGFAGVAIDPSRGQLLKLLVQTPTFRERLNHGGLIGYTIISLGLAGMLLGLLRLAQIGFTSLSVRRQKGPFKRIVKVYEDNPSSEVGVLERKLDEAIMHESTKLGRWLWALKIIYVVAPLMGLLGTVTGMIRTFQAITLYGTGDPKLMAGGISEALVTTMLGLVVAIPLVLLHSLLKSITGRTADVLEEQSVGFIARRAEAGSQ